jgi:hypothetical protein
MVDNRQSSTPLIFVGLIALGVAGAVIYFLAEPRLDRGTVNNVAYICAMVPLIVGGIMAFFVGLAWLDGRKHARRREDEALRGDVLYRRQQDAHAQSTDLAVLRQMTQVVEAGARAQLTAAKAQHEMARTAALQPDDDAGAYWTIPAEWIELDA